MERKKATWAHPLTISLLVLLLTCYCDRNDGNTPSEVMDADGNTYPTVTIGTQVWMGENLKTTTYRNGDPIMNGTSSTDWDTYTDGAYCDYGNNIDNRDIYGCLYNWYAVNTENLCPTGWHVPSDEEWTTLGATLGGDTLAGGKMKETGTVHWTDPNIDATNVSGFKALAGGGRPRDGSFIFIRLRGYWWTSTPYDNSDAWSRNIAYDSGRLYKSEGQNVHGLSVRCIQD